MASSISIRYVVAAEQLIGPVAASWRDDAAVSHALIATAAGTRHVVDPDRLVGEWRPGRIYAVEVDGHYGDMFAAAMSGISVDDVLALPEVGERDDVPRIVTWVSALTPIPSSA